MPVPCFSYPPDMPGSENRGAGQSVPPGLRRMPYSCFSYPDDVPAAIKDRAAAEPSLRDPRTMPYTCFRY